MAGVGPQVVQVLDFATARAPELQALHELAQHSDVSSAEADAKLLSQRNQRRRRANAFKSHQMPRRLRLPLAQPTGGDASATEEHIALGNRHGGGFSAVALSATEIALKARAKRNQKPRCRKHRRRMHRLLDDHSWLQPSHQSSNADDGEGEASELETAKWLPTHAWHAKRMRMREQFGHVLAQHRHDKSVSAALTALRTTATLHDASYYGVLELYGLDTLILEVLQLVTDPSGSDFDEVSFFDGDREGSSVLYHANQFPSGAIAPVSFMWRPLNSEDDMEKEEEDQERTPHKRQLWLWIHPAAFMEAATAIASACHEIMSVCDDTNTIDILDRRGHIARFQLRGKNAHAMIDKVLRAVHSPSPNESEEGGEQSDHEDGFALPLIHTTTATTNLTALRTELNKITDAAHNSERSLFSVRVQDPRLHSQCSQSHSSTLTSLHHEPTAAHLDAAGASILCPLSGLSLTTSDADEPDSNLILNQLEALLQWTTSASSGDATMYPFVSPAVEQRHKDGDVPMTKAASLSSEGAKACSDLWSLSYRGKAAMPPVPLILVWQPGTFKNTGGWDILLSPVYAPAFLNALVFSGAMVIGLDECEALETVAHSPSFPRDFPDTTAGQAYWDVVSDALESEYAKKPKAKRVAFDKLGVDSPFQPNWDVLFDETAREQRAAEEEEDGGEEVASLSSLCVLRSTSYMAPFPFARTMEQREEIDNSDAERQRMELIPVAVPTLIRVALSFPRRGVLEPCSMLYTPTAEDLTNFHQDSKWTGRQWDDSELELLGFVTSAVYDRPMGAIRGTAFCACEPLQRLALAPLQRSHEKMRIHLLALTRTPTSRQLRPVLLHILA